MRLGPWWCLLLIFFSCGRGSGPNHDETWQFIWEAYFRNDKTDVQTLLEKGLDESTADALWQTRFRLLAIECHSSKSQNADALLKELSEMASATSAHPDLEAWRLTLSGDLLGRKGQHEDANRNLDLASNIAVKADLPIRLSDAYFQKSWLVPRSERVDLLQAAIDAASRAEDALFYEVRASINLSNNLFILGDMPNALLLLDRVYPHLDKFSRYRARALANLGTVCNKLGYLEKARAVLSEGLQDQNLSSRIRSDLLAEMGNYAFAQLDFEMARTHYSEAFDLASASSQKWKWATNIGHVLIELGRYEEAAHMNEQARHILGEGDSPEHSRLAMQQAIITVRQQPDQAEPLLGEFGESPVPMTAFYALEEMARAARALNRTDVAERYFAAGLAKLEEASATLEDTELQIVSFAKSTYFLREYVDWLVSMERFQDALNVASFAQGRGLARSGDDSWPGLTQHLARLYRDNRFQDSVFLNYWLSPDTSHLWLIENGTIHYTPLAGSKTIEETVESWLNATAQKQVNGQPDIGKTLASLLFPESLKSKLRHAKSLVIIPDGALNRLNFDTLPNENGSFLVEAFAISHTPSLRVLDPRETNGAAIKKILTFTDPDYSQAGLQRLFSTAQTVPKLKSIFDGEITALTGEAATPAAFAAMNPQDYDLIHFGTHGEANLFRPLSAALILSPNQDNKTFKLYAEDILNHPIRAELVNLSSCESAGIRSYSGEGLVGMAWVFLRSGARHVIAGLWQVADEPSELLMHDMYEALASGLSPIQALREAKLAMISAGGIESEPFYWGAFPVYIR